MNSNSKQSLVTSHSSHSSHITNSHQSLVTSHQSSQVISHQSLVISQLLVTSHQSSHISHQSRHQSLVISQQSLVRYPVSRQLAAIRQLVSQLVSQQLVSQSTVSHQSLSLSHSQPLVISQLVNRQPLAVVISHRWLVSLVKSVSQSQSSQDHSDIVPQDIGHRHRSLQSQSQSQIVIGHRSQVIGHIIGQRSFTQSLSQSIAIVPQSKSCHSHYVSLCHYVTMSL